MKTSSQSNKRSRTYHSALNVALGFSNKVFTMILTFVSRAIFVRVLTQEYLGINGLFADILVMLSLADMGLGTAIVYSFYKPLADNDENKLAALVQFYRKVYTYIAFAVAAIGLSLLPFIDLIVNVDQPIPYLKVYYLIFLLNSVVSYLFVYKSCIIAADQKGYITTAISMWVSLGKLVIQTLVLYLFHNYLLFILVNVFATICNNLLISKKANQLYPYIKKKVELDKSEKVSIFSNIKAVFLYKVASVSLAGTDNTIISILVGTVSVGIYSNYYTIVSNIGAIGNIIFGSLTASIGNLIVQEGEKKRLEIFKIMQMSSFCIGGIFVVCAYFLINDFIVMWVGESYLFGMTTVVAILINCYLTLSLQPIFIFRESAGLYMQTKYVLLLTAIINIALSILLGKFYGVAGIIMATFIAKILTFFWYEPMLLYKEYFKSKVSTYFLDHVANACIIVGSIFILSFTVGQLKTTSVFMWILKAICIVLVMCSVYYLRYFKTKEFENVKQRIGRMIRGR